MLYILPPSKLFIGKFATSYSYEKETKLNFDFCVNRKKIGESSITGTFSIQNVFTEIHTKNQWELPSSFEISIKRVILKTKKVKPEIEACFSLIL